MKKILSLLFAFLFLSGILLVSESLAKGRSRGNTTVRGYTKKDGTYVAPYQRTSPNKSKMDNWSTKGNVNPYTGKEGTKDPYKLDYKIDGSHYNE